MDQNVLHGCHDHGFVEDGNQQESISNGIYYIIRPDHGPVYFTGYESSETFNAPILNPPEWRNQLNLETDYDGNQLTSTVNDSWQNMPLDQPCAPLHIANDGLDSSTPSLLLHDTSSVSSAISPRSPWASATSLNGSTGDMNGETKVVHESKSKKADTMTLGAEPSAGPTRSSFRCRLCSKSFTRDTDRNRHEKTKHSADRSADHVIFACGHCRFKPQGTSSIREKEFFNSRKDKVLDHLRSFHKFVALSKDVEICERDHDSVRAYYIFESLTSLLEHWKFDHDMDIAAVRPSSARKDSNAEDDDLMNNLEELAGDNNVSNQGLRKSLIFPRGKRQPTSMAAKAQPATKRQKAHKGHCRTVAPSFDSVEQQDSTAAGFQGVGKQVATLHPLALQGSGSGKAAFEIPDVKPAEVLLMTKHDDVLKAYRRLTTARVPFLQNVKCEPMGQFLYILKKSLIQLKGPVELAYLALGAVKEALAQIRSGNEEPPQDENGSPKFSRRPYHAMKVTQSGAQTGIQVYPLRLDQDCDQIATWKKVIMPSLPKILRTHLGPDFQAALVRQGRSECDARVCIRIQSPRKHPTTCKMVRREIEDVCKSKNVAPFNIAFSIGELRLLAGSARHKMSIDDDNTLGDAFAEEDAPKDDINHYGRFWRYAGMGASLGLSCNEEVSGTLGGYIQVGGVLYALTTDHFIQQALRHTNGLTVHAENPSLDVISPSSMDLTDVRESLRSNIHGTEIEIKLLMSQRESIDFGEVFNEQEELTNRYEKDLRDWYEKLLCWSREHKQAQREFAFGKVRQRCGKQQILVLHDNEQVPRRMDWAVCEVFGNRKGENRHRFERPITHGDQQWQTEGVTPRGAGKECTETTKPKANAKVHYVGASTGYQSGTIRDPETLNSYGGHATVEWSLDMDDKGIADHDGDSGAWIIETESNKLVGMLWGEQDGLLHFTPIEELFQDIADDMKEPVRLPREFPPTPEAENIGVRSIARVQKQRDHPEKSRVPIKRPPWLQQRLELAARPSLGTLTERSKTLDLAPGVVRHEKSATREIIVPPRTPSPAPTLLSSSTSTTRSSSGPLTPGMEPETLVRNSNTKDSKHSLDFIMGSFTLGQDREDDRFGGRKPIVMS